MEGVKGGLLGVDGSCFIITLVFIYPRMCVVY